MPCPTPKFKLKEPAYQRGNCAGNSKSLKQTECLNSVVDDKSIFVRVTVCEIPLDAVCDTGASVSCLSPKRLNIRNIHHLARRHVRPEQCSDSIKAEAHRNHQV